MWSILQFCVVNSMFVPCANITMLQGPALAWLQSITWAKAKPKQELAHKWEGLARKYED